MPNNHPSGPSAANDSEPARDGGRREAAHYIKGAIEELSALARTHRLDMLGYLLDMAHLEADDAARRDFRNPL